VLAREAQQQPEEQAAEQKREDGDRFGGHAGNYSGNPHKAQRGAAVQAAGRGLRRFQSQTT
jgi:hypothetical protein